MDRIGSEVTFAWFDEVQSIDHLVWSALERQRKPGL